MCVQCEAKSKSKSDGMDVGVGLKYQSAVCKIVRKIVKGELQYMSYVSKNNRRIEFGQNMENWASTLKVSPGQSASIDVIIFSIRPPEVEKMRILRLATGKY